MRVHREALVLALALSLLLCRPASAQYRFDTWTTDNGLPQNGVRAITQTPDGYLWFTTFDGLVRFDGVQFTTFGTGNTKGIINNRFTGLYRDRDGTLYASTTEDGVLTVYRDGVFSSYTSAQVPGHYIQRMAPDPRGEMRILVEDDDRTTRSWYYLRGGQFVFSEKIDPDAQVDRRHRTGRRIVDGHAAAGCRAPQRPDHGLSTRHQAAKGLRLERVRRSGRHALDRRVRRAPPRRRNGPPLRPGRGSTAIDPSLILGRPRRQCLGGQRRRARRKASGWCSFATGRPAPGAWRAGCSAHRSPASSAIAKGPRGWPRARVWAGCGRRSSRASASRTASRIPRSIRSIATARSASGSARAKA